MICFTFVGDTLADSRLWLVSDDISDKPQWMAQCVELDPHPQNLGNSAFMVLQSEVTWLGIYFVIKLIRAGFISCLTRGHVLNFLKSLIFATLYTWCYILIIHILFLKENSSLYRLTISFMCLQRMVCLLSLCCFRHACFMRTAPCYLLCESWHTGQLCLSLHPLTLAGKRWNTSSHILLFNMINGIARLIEEMQRATCFY